MPCDIDVCKYTPSPGDTGPGGCGLLPVNDFAVWLFPRWKTFGPKIFEFVEPLAPEDGALLVEKFMLIEEYGPAIAAQAQRRADNRSLHKPKRKKGK